MDKLRWSIIVPAMEDELSEGGNGRRIGRNVARDRERRKSTRRKFLKRSGGVTIAVTLAGVAAPSLVEAESSA